MSDQATVLGYGPIEAVERLHLHPGDVVVVRCRAGTTEQDKQQVAKVMTRVLPGYVKVAIGSVVEGLTVVTPEQEASDG